MILIYQKLLMGSKPYFISVGGSVPVDTHRHPEIELSFCLEGSYDIICENRSYSLSAGELAPEKVVYVSCNPETLARDASFLTRKGYKVRKIQGVDMFPHTEHVETVALFCKK